MPPTVRTTWPPRRGAGVLLHPTSLPGGRLDAEAYRFVDWLVAAGQSIWQILPLGPPDRHSSPYASTSAFAGSTQLLAAPDAPVTPSELRHFRRAHAYWIEGWAEYAGGDDAIADQVRFEREWGALRRYANERGVALLGDVPIYVARESADVAAHPRLFDLTLQAGVPPDLFSATGQLWRNPTFDWRRMRADGFSWWIERLRRTLSLVDATRIDHFRGFVAYWAVPVDAVSAEGGHWRRGPGRGLFDAAREALGQLPIVAEDLGVITPPVHRLRDEIGALGLHVLQFGFGRDRSAHAPGTHRELAVVATGTHDNAPARAWWDGTTLDARERVQRAAARASIDAAEPWWTLIELAHASRARVAIVQLQDVLGLGAEARMNTPATSEGNWRWQLEPGELDQALAERLHRVTSRYERI